MFPQTVDDKTQYGVELLAEKHIIVQNYRQSYLRRQIKSLQIWCYSFCQIIIRKMGTFHMPVLPFILMLAIPYGPKSNIVVLLRCSGSPYPSGSTIYALALELLTQFVFMIFNQLLGLARHPPIPSYLIRHHLPLVGSLSSCAKLMLYSHLPWSGAWTHFKN